MHETESNSYDWCQTERIGKRTRFGCWEGGVGLVQGSVLGNEVERIGRTLTRRTMCSLVYVTPFLLIVVGFRSRHLKGDEINFEGKNPFK